MLDLWVRRRLICNRAANKLDTECHDSIISYLVSFYQMLSSAKSNWFATGMKGWQTVIHHSLYIWVCACSGSPRGSRMKGNNSLSDANSLVAVSAVRASMESVWCACINVGVWTTQQERNVWGDHFKPKDKDSPTGLSSYIPSSKHQYNEELAGFEQMKGH